MESIRQHSNEPLISQSDSQKIEVKKLFDDACSAVHQTEYPGEAHSNDCTNNGPDQMTHSDSIDHSKQDEIIKYTLNSDDIVAKFVNNEFCQAPKNKNNILDLRTTDNSKNFAEVYVPANRDVLNCDPKSNLINSDDINTVNVNSNNKLPILNCHDSNNANELGMMRIETSSILSKPKQGEKEKSNLKGTEDVEHLKKSISRVPIQTTLSSENLNSGKEKNLNNSDLAKNKQNNTKGELMHKNEFFKKPEDSDSDDISTYNNEIQSNLKEKNPRRFQKQQDTSSTLSSDQLQTHLSKGLKTFTPDEFETGMNEYSDNSIMSSVANLTEVETKPSFNFNEKCNLVSNNLNMSFECTKEGYAKETRNNYLHEMSNNKMSMRQENKCESPDSYHIITENDSDPLCPSLEYECNKNFDSNIKLSTNRNDEAINLAKESFKPDNSLSSLQLPFTSEYIIPKIDHFQDSFHNLSLHSTSQRNPSQNSKKLSCQSTANKKIELTKKVDKKSFVSNEMEKNESSYFVQSRYISGNEIQDWPLKIQKTSISQRSLNTGGIDMRNRLITRTDPYTADGSNYQLLQGTFPIGQFGVPRQNLTGRRNFTRYPTIISLDDIQEVKSQDEKSSYTDARNNYNS